VHNLKCNCFYIIFSGGEIMPNLEVAGKTIPITEEGYLEKFEDWNEEVANILAKEEEIELTENHWKVIKTLQKKFEETGELPTLRRLSKESGLKTKDLYDLFPKKPLKKAAKIAGLPKPTGCG
jgi:tRNA 2-thiouridine synthesizing protein E